MSPRAIPFNFSHRTAILGCVLSGAMHNTRPDGSDGGDQPVVPVKKFEPDIFPGGLRRLACGPVHGEDPTMIKGMV
ncbi:hypothetical protein MGG_15771 [Pyricularia oryzae 70-15]|uniref:Uncharacterized protein n=2 Tax=Pyricularia oryzae TaxID=318829 RepID=G4MVT8_PYRO7|nr:uncharacterized protein MGG_15771 [Pyricularia oryzae 70-15]EHA55004.1 hypothetical protein MGG_15771 [Pyricularia oryzae 70-15]